MKSDKKIIFITLLIPLVFISGIATGLLLQEISYDFEGASDNQELQQDDPIYGFYDDFVLLNNATNLGISSGICAVIYNENIEAEKNVSLYINNEFHSIATSIKSITICRDPWLVFGGWLFKPWNTTSYENGRHLLTVYVNGNEVSSTYVYIKN